ncbi:hypothetical protein BJX66DRAFT_331171 [Aspergillus keveii]|uniref:Zn(2)-C6 fungal-type domain-containing protein n=1 Tax=Aspergillus keveii TaxID=714993 RepID=A0ABR4FHA7_9EURO
MASRTTKASLRPLLPATASCSTPVQEPTQRNRKRHRQTTACTSCQAKRIKCSGSSPCDGCTERDSACYYDPRKDRRRKEALKHAEQSKKALEAVIAILYNGTEVDLHELKTEVKSFASPEAAMEELFEHVFI